MSKHKVFLIEPNALYPLEWLEEQLGSAPLKTLLKNIGLDCAGRGRVNQNFVLGEEILRAYIFTIDQLKTPETACMGVSGRRSAAVGTANNGKRKRGRPARTVDLIRAEDLA